MPKIQKHNNHGHRISIPAEIVRIEDWRVGDMLVWRYNKKLGMLQLEKVKEK